MNIGKIVLIAASPLLVSVSGHAQDKAKTIDKTPVAVKETAKVKKITDRRHPDYVRCRKEPVIGSLSKKRKICMTNKQWKAHIREGNKRATELIDENRPGATSGQ